MKPSDFKVGEPVEHMNGDTGKVTGFAKNGAVLVTYDRGNGYWKGEYDDLWFCIHPEGLKKLNLKNRDNQ